MAERRFVRLSVPVDREAADAARHLRSWFSTPGAADLCAGVPTIDSATLERLHTSVANLQRALDGMLRQARGPQRPSDPTEPRGLHPDPI